MLLKARCYYTVIVIINLNISYNLSYHTGVVITIGISSVVVGSVVVVVVVVVVFLVVVDLFPEI